MAAAYDDEKTTTGYFGVEYSQKDKNVAQAAGKGVVSGASKGASMGAVASPWGALIGGIIGGVAGGIYGGVKEKKSLEAAQEQAEEAFDAKQDAAQLAGRNRALRLSEDELLVQQAAAPQSGSGYDMWHANTYGKM